MKKVLLITYDFPPARTSGIYRPVKFVKHLRRFGWEPIVLTSKNPYVVMYDETLLADLPENIRVERAFSPDLMRFSARVHQLLFGKAQGSPRVQSSNLALSGSPNGGVHSRKKSWVKRKILSPLNRFIVNWTHLPDSKVPWVPFALWKALRIIKSEKPDVIITTSAPPNVQLIGLLLRFFSRRPWVVDLRDNWVVGYSQNYGSSLRVRVDMWLMKQVLKRADAVVTMCDGNRDDIRAAFPDLPLCRFRTITNGFDQDDFFGIESKYMPQRAGKLRLLHVGTLYRGTAGCFFEGLADLLKNKWEIRNDIEVDFIGTLCGDYPDRISELGLSDVVQMHDFRTHPEIIKAMLEADALLLFMGVEKIMNQQFPGKFFEYLKAERPILAFGREGEIARAMSECRSGYLFPPDDVEAIKSGLSDIWQRKMNNKLQVAPNSIRVREYEYASLTRQLSDLLFEVTEERKDRVKLDEFHRTGTIS